jgi:hypothetical protein
MKLVCDLNSYKNLTIVSMICSGVYCLTGMVSNDALLSVIGLGFLAIFTLMYGVFTYAVIRPVSYSNNSEYVAYSNVLRYLNQKKVNYGNNRIIVSAIKYVTELRDKSA